MKEKGMQRISWSVTIVWVVMAVMVLLSGVSWGQQRTVLYKDFQQTVSVPHVWSPTVVGPPFTVAGNGLGVPATGLATDMAGRVALGSLPAAGVPGRMRQLGSGGAISALVLDNGVEWNCDVAKSQRIAVVTCPPWNANGTGVVDDSAAVQAAASTAMRIIYFPGGTYTLGTGITLTSGKHLMGAGIGVTLVKLAAGMTLPTAFGGNVPIEDIEISNMTIDGNRSLNPAVGAALVGFGATDTTAVMDNIRIHDVVVQNSTEYCIGLEGGTIGNVFVTNVLLDGCDRDGMDIKSNTDGNKAIFIDNVHVSRFGLADPASGQAGLDIRGHAHLSNIRVDDVNGNHSGIRFGRGQTAAEAIADPAGPLTGSQGSSLTGFQIYGTHAGGENSEGLRIRSADIAVSNGFISGVNRGVFLDALVNVWGITFTGVSVTGTKDYAFSSQGAFDKGTGYVNCNANNNLGDGFLIVGDQTRLLSSAAMGNGGIGIGITSAATAAQIIGNYTIGNGTNWVNDGVNTHADGNVGIRSVMAGVGVLASGDTSVVVSHLLAEAPPINWITLTPLGDTSVDIGPLWPSNVTSTQFTIHVRNSPGAGGANIGWTARTLP